MTVHLLKLCVGAESLEDQMAWSAQRLLSMQTEGLEPQLYHITRMTPKRRDELLDGGSLYWVIKGQIQARQELLDIIRFNDNEGIGRCKLVLSNTLIATQWQPRRAFQGWRYLKGEDAPFDLASGASELPLKLKSELAELGLL